MKKFAVIVAGGSGLRMGTETPKQFLLLNEKSVLWHSVNSFLNAYDDLKVIIVLPEEHFAKGEELQEEFMDGKQKIALTIGGRTRFQSVKNGLAFVEKDAIVFVHDAVRCLITKDLIERCYEQTIQFGSAIPAVAATDSIRIIENNQHHVADRNDVRIIQTPQTFLSTILIDAFNQPYQENFTDEATVVEATGQKVFLCEGDYNNIKITRPVDFLMAKNYLK